MPYDCLLMRKGVLFLCISSKLGIFFALSVCAWSHLVRLRTPFLMIFLCINFIAVFVVVVVTTFVIGYFENMSIATSMHVSFLNISGIGSAKSRCTS